MKLKIEKLVYGGEGLARFHVDASERGKTVFVPYTLPEEEVEAEIVEEKQGFARAKLTQIVKPSASRVEPKCPLFTKCGGCDYQHTNYENQLALKEQILRETLMRTSKIEWKGAIKVHAGEPWQYRNRARFRVAGADGTDTVFGFNRTASSEVIAVRECPIISPLIGRALSAMWKTTDASVHDGVEEIEFFTNAEDTELMAEVMVKGPNMRAMAETLEPWLARMQSQVPELRGAGIFPAFGFTGAQDQSWNETSLDYLVVGNSYRVSAGSFFQTNRFLVDEMVRAAVGDAEGQTAWDLYAGVGLFTLALLDRFQKVVAVESSRFAVTDLMENVRVKNKGDFRVESTTTESFLMKGKTGLRPDFILLDPPRAGLGEKPAKLLAEKGATRISYVSCDPATLARDLRVLTGADYKIQEIHLFDLFPQTYHLETVVHLKKS